MCRNILTFKSKAAEIHLHGLCELRRLVPPAASRRLVGAISTLMALLAATKAFALARWHLGLLAISRWMPFAITVRADDISDVARRAAVGGWSPPSCTRRSAMKFSSSLALPCLHPCLNQRKELFLGRIVPERVDGIHELILLAIDHVDLLALPAPGFQQPELLADPLAEVEGVLELVVAPERFLLNGPREKPEDGTHLLLLREALTAGIGVGLVRGIPALERSGDVLRLRHGCRGDDGVLEVELLGLGLLRKIFSNAPPDLQAVLALRVVEDLHAASSRFSFKKPQR